MKKSKFLEKIRDAKLEKEVELIYKKELCYYYPDATISNPYGCDGLIQNGKLKLIMELKYSEDFLNKSIQCKVIIQALYYVKKFQIDNVELPNVILIGDKDEVFVINNNVISKYIDENLDWNVAPSKASLKNSQLILKMVKDDDITPHIFYIDERFSFQQVIDEINSCIEGLKSYVDITEKNISEIYDYFIITVVKNYRQYSSNELVNVFINLMVNPQETFQIPEKKNLLLLPNRKKILIDKDRFKAFFDHFRREYSPKEKDKFTEIADRLIEDTSRRAKGEFYTPTIWVNEANKMISNVIGNGWRQRYTVWDCAWGTGNLTRDFYFNRLFCSTLHNGDLEIGDRYNNNAIEKFQYDFLNDDVDLLEGKELFKPDLKMPQSLLKDLENNSPILFFVNPPYGSAGTMKTDGSYKKNISNSSINKLMKKNKIGSCSQQLFAQFLYRILLFKQRYNLSDVVICLFSSPIFMTGSSFKKFREKFLANFKYEDAMLFDAQEFDGVSSGWGVSFSIWTTGKTNDRENFYHHLKELSNGNNLPMNKIINFGSKRLYNLDYEKSFSDWIKEDVINLKTYDAPLLSSALVVKKHGYGRLAKNSFGYYVNSGNSVYDNNNDVYILSGCATRGHGISILPSNFNRVMANFAARKCITGKYANWKNNKDEYCIPDTNHKLYSEFISDAIIYSLFNTSSNQSALRNIRYKETLINIENQFFFMSNMDIRNLANKYNNDEVYTDARNYSVERYTYSTINEMKLSIEAMKVLSKAKYLVEKSFEYRQILNEEHPEYNLNTWDAGWYQIKLILKRYFKEELVDFNYLYKILEQKIRLMIYELGILKK